MGSQPANTPLLNLQKTRTVVIIDTFQDFKRIARAIRRNPILDEIKFCHVSISKGKSSSVGFELLPNEQIMSKLTGILKTGKAIPPVLVISGAGQDYREYRFETIAKIADEHGANYALITERPECVQDMNALSKFIKERGIEPQFDMKNISYAYQRDPDDRAYQLAVTIHNSNLNALNEIDSGKGIVLVQQWLTNWATSILLKADDIIRDRAHLVHVRTLEEALNIANRFKERIIGAIIEKKERPAYNGIVEAIRGSTHREVPVIVTVKSGDEPYDPRVFYIELNPITFSHKLGDFMLKNFGLGPFIFKLTNGSTIKANNLQELKDAILNADDAALLNHSNRNHFSAWLKNNGYYELAALFEPIRIQDPTQLRATLVGYIDYLLPKCTN